MNSSEVRKKYLDFFKSQGHTVIPSSSLVPEGDSTTLFTGSGMQPLLPYLLGRNHPAGSRLTDSQKCLRSMDIEEVGDNRHTTFFEMLGNWSFGDYFKKEQLPWFFEFLTDEVRLDPSKLYVTVFLGDEKNNVPKDTESAGIWKELFTKKGVKAEIVEIGSEANGYEKGMQGGRIFYYDAKKNWWSRAGTPDNMPAGEPGGPDSEVFYDFGTPHDKKFGKECHPNCDCGRFLEIGNSVFMQYIKKEDGSFGLLPKQNVDFGGGLERITAASIGNADVFRVDTLWNVVAGVERALADNGSDCSYDHSVESRNSLRIIADHIRAATFMMADGVSPSNTERGYVLRRLLRRAVLHIDKLGNGAGALEKGIAKVVDSYEAAYPELRSREKKILAEASAEEEKFRKTLALGMKEFEKMSKAADKISAEQAFILFSTYGFPFEMTEELARERKIPIDVEGFKEQVKKHQEISRAGVEQKFRGGLADHAEKTIRLHTAHHLLLRALQIVLGPEVRQRGSNITQERLRIDFNWGEKLTDEQKKEVERIVNEKIAEDLPVIRSEMDKEKAEKLGAQHEFGAKYPDMVSVYSVGPKDATLEDPKFDKAFSIEFCGGPHVKHTGEIGKFHIIKEEAVSAGIRRIRADVN